MISSGTQVREIREERRGDVPLFAHPEWERDYPWLVHGTTARAAGNFASFGSQSIGVVHEQWRRLRSVTKTRVSVLGRQVHGAHIMRHGPLTNGLLLADDSDGHITREREILLAVSVADCVPVFVVAEQPRTVAVLHAGWRGVAAGILTRCIEMVGTSVHVHFGPAICGKCYEVGPEVHAALRQEVPAHNAPVDLRAILGQQCSALGVPPENVTRSSWCTRCAEPPFFSHRAGHAERQVGVIGIR